MEKKQIILLPGNSKVNIPWLEDTKNVLDKTYNIKEIRYNHWESDLEINFDDELTKLKNISSNMKNYFVVAKSIGSIITLLGINRNIIDPEAVVILGFPLNLIKKENYDVLPLIKDNIKVLVIQQKNDILGKSEQVKKYLPSYIDIIEIPGEDHFYSDIELIKPIIDNYLNKGE